MCWKVQMILCKYWPRAVSSDFHDDMKISGGHNACTMNPGRIPPSLRMATHAFTLVEVVLALGVASFALLSMMGLLTVGLADFHDAMNASTETQIAQQLASQIELSDFSVASNQAAGTYYFTDEGLATNAAGAVYSATVSAPAKLYVPGEPANSSSTNTLTFLISISCKSSPQTTNVIPIQIANNGS